MVVNSVPGGNACHTKKNDTNENYSWGKIWVYTFSKETSITFFFIIHKGAQPYEIHQCNSADRIQFSFDKLNSTPACMKADL